MDHLHNDLESRFMPDAIGIRRQHGRETFADGTGWAEPWAWAGAARRMLGTRAKLLGFWSFENPSADLLETVSDHHAFALVDERFLVDGWSRHVMGLASSAVFDLSDPATLATHSGIFGSPHCWEELHWLEDEVDTGPALARDAARRAVGQRESLPPGFDF